MAEIEEHIQQQGPNKGKHNAINPTQCIKEKIKTPTTHFGSSNYFFGWSVIFILCWGPRSRSQKKHFIKI